MNPDAVARLLVTVFFAVIFTQSALDKLFDREGNLAYLSEHFKNAPLPHDAVGVLLSILTAIEATAGVLCGLGVLTGGFTHTGFSIAACGVIMAGVALLCLMIGQRLAKDYAGAAVIAAYFAVALIGIALY
jgi:putative oxidoreductase